MDDRTVMTLIYLYTGELYDDFNLKDTYVKDYEYEYELTSKMLVEPLRIFLKDNTIEEENVEDILEDIEYQDPINGEIYEEEELKEYLTDYFRKKAKKKFREVFF